MTCKYQILLHTKVEASFLFQLQDNFDLFWSNIMPRIDFVHMHHHQKTSTSYETQKRNQIQQQFQEQISDVTDAIHICHFNCSCISGTNVDHFSRSNHGISMARYLS